VRAGIGRRDVGSHGTVDQQRWIVAAATEAAGIVADLLAKTVHDHAVNGIVE
jgi:hypothetical protein